MKVAWSLIFFTFNLALVLGDAPVSVLVFFPEGATANLSTSGGPRPLTSGTPLLLEAGEADLTVNHENFEPYVRHLTLESGRELVLIPRLRSSARYRQAQASALAAQRERVQQQKDGVAAVAWGLGTLALVGWATVGGLEWSLANKKAALGDAQAAYRAASSDQAVQLWSSIEGLKTEIATLRTYETYALGGSGGLSLGAIVLWLHEPDTSGLDQMMQALE